MSHRLIREDLLKDTLEAIKASEFDCEIGKSPDESSAKYLGELRAKLEKVLDIEEPQEGEPTDEEYVNTAREIYHKDGETEIDAGAIVSRGDDPGAYVMAWVWVYAADVDPKYEEPVTDEERSNGPGKK